MAQAQTAVYFWQERLSTRASTEPSNEELDATGPKGWKRPRISDSEAIEQAAGMVDRFNRIYLRTLRALRDLRRYPPTVVVQNAVQVNVGGQQVNLATDAEPGGVRADRLAART
jgi:hypothetical protein